MNQARVAEEAESRQVCGFFVGLREHDPHFVVHAGDDPDDARDRGEEREEPEGLRAVEAGEGGGAGMVPAWARVVPVMNLRTSVAKEDDRVGSGLGIGICYF